MKARLVRFSRESYVSRLAAVADDLLMWAAEYDERVRALGTPWLTNHHREQLEARAKACRSLAHQIEQIYAEVWSIR